VNLVDLDILFKFATWDLLAEMQASLDPGRIYVPASAFRPKFSRAINAKYPAAGLQRYRDFIQAHAQIIADPSMTAAPFTGIEGIDPGEVVLFAAATIQAASIVWTGDKRALTGLTRVDPSASASLRGRIVCMPQLLSRVISNNTFDRIRAQICTNLEIDTEIRSWFGSKLQTTRANVEAGIASTLSNLPPEVQAFLKP
jgi:hypothetical protein